MVNINDIPQLLAKPTWLLLKDLALSGDTFNNLRKVSWIVTDD